MAEIPVFGTKYEVKDPKTGETLDSFKTAQEAYEAGVLSSPTLSGLTEDAPIYGSKGKWTLTEPTKSTVSLDKATGKIVVKGPSKVMNYQPFQDQWKEELDNLSLAYKTGGEDAQLVRTKEGTEGEQETITVADRIAEINNAVTVGEGDKAYTTSPIQSSVDYYGSIIQNTEVLGTTYRQLDMEGNVLPIEFDEADIIRMRQNGTGEGVNDKTRISVPKGIKGLEKVYNDADWDDISQTISIKAFKDTFYDIDKSGESAIYDVYSDLERYLAKAAARPTNSENVDKDKLTGALALYTYMRHNSPQCNFWTGATYVMSAPVKGLANFAGGLGTLLATGLTWSTDLMRNFSQWLDATLSGKSADNLIPVNNAKVVYEQLSFGQQALGNLPNYLSGDFDKDIAKAVSTLNLDVQEQLTRVQQLTDSLGGGSGSFSMNSTADAIQAISENIYQLIALIGVGNAFQGAVTAGSKATAKAAVATAERILAGGATASELTGAAAKLVALMGSKNAATLYSTLAGIANNKAIGFGLELIMETIGEGLVQNPSRLAEIIAEPGLLSEDGLVYLGETLYGNAIGGAVGITIGKTAMAVGETVPGKIITSKMRNGIYKVQAGIADFFDSLRMKWGNYTSVNEWIKDTFNPKVAQTMIDNRSLRELRKAIANDDTLKLAGKSYDELVETLDKIEDRVNNYQKYANALRDYNTGSRLQIKLWQYSDDNPAFKKTNQKLTSLSGEIMEAEASAGFKSAAKKNAGALFSQETTNYIGASVRVPILQNVLDTTKDVATKKSINEEIAHWTKVMTDYESKATPELLALVKDYSTNYKKWWNQANNLFMKEGLLDPEDIEAWRQSGQWGDNGELYARLQRRTEANKYMVTRTDGRVDTKLSRDLGHYGYGNTEDFVDPQLVMQQELRVQADIKRRNELIQTFSTAKGSTTLYTAEQTALKTEVAPKIKQYNKEVKQSLKDITTNLDREGYFEEAFAKVNAQDKVAALRRQQTAISRSVLTDAPITAAEQQTLITVMPDSEISTLYGLVTNDEPLEEAMVGFQSSRWGKTVRPEVQAEVDRLYKAGDITNNRLTQQNIRYALNSNPDLSSSIKRAILAQDPRVAAEPYIKEMIEQNRYENFLDGLYGAYNANQEELARGLASLELSSETMQTVSRDVLEDFSSTFYGKNTIANQIGDDLAGRFGKEQPEVIKQYLMYDAMKHNKKAITDQVKAKAREYFDKYTLSSGKNISAKQADYLSNQLAKQISAEIDLKFNASRNVVAELGGDAKALIDGRKWQSEIYKEAKEIGAKLEADNVFLMRNTSGQMETIEVDPLIADIVGTKTLGEPMKGVEKLNYMWMRLFRMGTTGINPTSLVNQYWRDMGNAWIMGNVTQTIKQSEEIIGEVFGEDIGRAMAQYSEEAQENFRKLAKEQGRSLEEVLASAERSRGRIIAEASTETEAMRLYGQTREMWYKGDATSDTLFDKANSAVDWITDHVGRLNEVRETYLRDLVYNNNYAKALQNGRSIEQARIYAQYIAANATTDFNQATTFLARLQNSIPYLRSAINGTKSFWRLWSLDPVGYTGRIVGGMIIPAIGITSMSMNGEENRKVYKNIPEYRKENALPVVVNGKYFSIPLPQELSALINPFRHMIEGINGMHDGSAMEVIANDILAFSPLDFGGFTNLDSVDMFAPQGGTPWTQRLGDGFAQLFSQIAPKYLVSAATAVSGYDLYTGQKIDTSFVTIDPETGEQLVMSYNAGAFSKWLASVFPGVSAPVAQEVLDTLFGDTPQDMLDWLWTIGDGAIASATTEDGGAAFGNAFMTATGNVANLFTKVNMPFYQDQTDKAWRNAVSQLYNMKNQLLSGEAWQAYMKNQRNAVTQTEKEAASTARANILNEYYSQVKNVVENLLTTYEGSLTADRYASIISLMTMHEANTSINSVTRQANQDLYYQAKNAAVQTMIEMGFPPTATDTVWGQYKTAADGSVYLQYATPLQILDMRNTRYNQGNIHEASLEEILSSAGIKRSDMFTEYYKATTKAEKKQAKADWNAKVVKALFPYIDKYGAENVINSQVADLLEDYIFVDNPYTAKQYLIKIFGGNT